MNFKYLIYSILCAVLMFGCNPDLDYSVKGYTQKIIVEAKIESGKYPEVYLSLNVPLSKKIDSTNILDHVIRYAKVTISNGEETEILTSKWDISSFPPYVYKGTEIVGEEGKKYDLKVEYGGYTLYSTTTIPKKLRIDSVVSFPSQQSDTLKSLSVCLNVDMHKKNSFRIYSKKPKDKKFVETPTLFNAELNLFGNQVFRLSPRPTTTDVYFNESSYFALGDTIDIKVCAIDSISTLFFKDLSFFSVVAGNIFTNEVKPLKSNITEPGFGIWYGSAVQHIRYVVK